MWYSFVSVIENTSPGYEELKSQIVLVKNKSSSQNKRPNYMIIS